MSEPVRPQPPRPVRHALLVQRWHHVTFLHWAAAPEAVQPFLPPGTRADTLDGRTYIGLIGLRIAGTRLGAGLVLPYVGTFAELNVRLYAVDEQGRRGVVFLSLDAARLLPALVARAGLRLPYRWSAARMGREGPMYSYTCRRRGGPGRDARSRIVIRAGEPIRDPSPLEHFVTARWWSHVRAYGRTRYVPIAHPQWPLCRAELLSLDDELVPAAGLPTPGEPPVSVLYSPGVRVRFGLPGVVR